MHLPLPRLLRLLLGLLTLAPMLAAQTPAPGGRPVTLKFAGVEYLHRWTKDTQHELTPRGQEDLQRWTDMLTLNYYPPAPDKDGDVLANTANAVLENYKRNGAIVARTRSIPRTPTKPAEHFIAVLFPQKEFTEAVFARFVNQGAGGMSVIYCHRIYGAKAGEQMSAWLPANGPKLEDELLALKNLPAAGSWKK